MNPVSINRVDRVGRQELPYPHMDLSCEVHVCGDAME